MLNLNEIRAARARLNISQDIIAKELNLSITGYGFKERGKNDFTITELAKISLILNLDFVVNNGVITTIHRIVNSNGEKL